FSSRRRHTRSYGDWSSDVCSSDLPCALAVGAIAMDTANEATPATAHSHLLNRSLSAICVSFARIVFPRRIEPAHGICQVLAPARSEERRVGKDCMTTGGS